LGPENQEFSEEIWPNMFGSRRKSAHLHFRLCPGTSQSTSPCFTTPAAQTVTKKWANAGLFSQLHSEKNN